MLFLYWPALYCKSAAYLENKQPILAKSPSFVSKLSLFVAPLHNEMGFAYRGPAPWNKLPNEHKMINNFNSFRNALNKRIQEQWDNHPTWIFPYKWIMMCSIHVGDLLPFCPLGGGDRWARADQDLASTSRDPVASPEPQGLNAEWWAIFWPLARSG